MASGAVTRLAILRAAERLFAERGFAGASLRGIVAEAGVNLAAVNYHFGSKEGLIRAVFAWRLEPLNRERLRLLDGCEAGGGGGTLEGILEALIRPALHLSRDERHGGVVFMRLLGRTMSEGEGERREMLDGHLAETVQRFTRALQRVLPWLPAEDFYWRLHFTVGAMASAMYDRERPLVHSGGRCDPTDVEGLIRHLVAFSAGGLRARVVSRSGEAGA